MAEEKLSAPILTREELVAVVKAIVGDMNALKDTMHHLPVYPGGRSLEVEFERDGRESLGTFVVPIPESILEAQSSSASRAGYNRLTARVRIVNAEPGPAMAPREE